jgi:hypothetical protein
MKAGPESTRWRITLWGSGLSLFIVLAAMQWHQARQTLFLEPAGVDSTTNAYATWTAAPEQFAIATLKQTFEDPFLMLGPVNSGIPATGTAVLYDLPYARDGYALNLAVARADNRAPPLLTLSINNHLLRTIQVPGGPRLGEKNPFHSEELMIPGSLLQPGQTNRLAIRTVRGLHWQGDLALIPHAPWRQWLPLLVPFSGWCVLASALFILISPVSRRWFPLLLLPVLFVIYYQTFFIRDMAPVTGFFFSDAADFIDPVCHKIFNYDMNKHPLFLPVIRFAIKPLYFILREEIAAVSAAFALIGALNGMMAFLWFRRWLGDFRTAGALTLLYAFSLAIWVYSSHYETYVFSSLIGNLFFWALLRSTPPDQTGHLLGPSLAIGLAGLAHPPMLILFGVLVIHVWSRRARPFPWKGLIASALVASAVFLGGQILIRSYYADRTQLPLAIDNRLRTSPDPVSREIGNIQWIYHYYANEQRFNSSQIGNVLTGQFVYSLAGLPYPFDWARGVAGLRDFFQSVTGPPALGAIFFLWLGALIGLMSNRRFLGNSLILLVGIMAPWLTFFILFNPAEMLLYSAPMIAPILAWLGGASGLAFKRYTTGFLLAISLILAIHNTGVLTSYY